MPCKAPRLKFLARYSFVETIMTSLNRFLVRNHTAHKKSGANRSNLNMNSREECGEWMERFSQSCCKTKEGGPGRPLIKTRFNCGSSRSNYFPPLKISQSCDDVPMNKSIGRDNHALVREAIKD